jgi:Amt family ammonium transporter
MGGIVGLLFNGFFATNNVIALDGVSSSIEGGWLDHNWKQMYKQIAYIVAVCAYSFVMTAILAHLVNLVPGLTLRATAEDERLGMDDAQIGEFANDYVEVRRDFTDWTPEPSGIKSSGRWDSEEGPMTHVGTAHSQDGHIAVAAGGRHGVPDFGPDEQEHEGAHRDRGRPAQSDLEKRGARQSNETGEHSGSTRITAGDRHGGGTGDIPPQSAPLDRETEKQG